MQVSLSPSIRQSVTVNPEVKPKTVELKAEDLAAQAAAANAVNSPDLQEASLSDVQQKV